MSRLLHGWRRIPRPPAVYLQPVDHILRGQHGSAWVANITGAAGLGAGWERPAMAACPATAQPVPSLA